MFSSKPTKTSQTIAEYGRIARTLLRRADHMEALGHLPECSDWSLRLAFAYCDAEPNISAASARLYRAAAMFAIRAMATDQLDIALEIIAPAPSDSDYLREERLAAIRAARSGVLRCAQQKAKWLPERDWKTLLSALANSPNVWGVVAVLWLKATMAVGLRPKEWCSASITGDVLVIQNAKNTNGRACGAERRICLIGASADERAAVREFLDIASELEAKGHFHEAYCAVRKLVWKTSRSSLSMRTKYPSLYTARHVFCARAKAVHGHRWVADLMGHASTVTASRHYAKAWRARGGRKLGVKPASPPSTSYGA